jgi:hypothetical protein
MDWRDRVTRLAPPPHFSQLHRSLSQSPMVPWIHGHTQKRGIWHVICPTNPGEATEARARSLRCLDRYVRSFQSWQLPSPVSPPGVKKGWLFCEKSISWGRRFHRTRCTLAQMLLLPSSASPRRPPVGRSVRDETRPSSPLVSSACSNSNRQVRQMPNITWNLHLSLKCFRASHHVTPTGATHSYSPKSCWAARFKWGFGLTCLKKRSDVNRLSPLY